MASKKRQMLLVVASWIAFFILLGGTLAFIKTTHYAPTTTPHWADCIVSFSFDDGTLDFLENAHPILSEKDIPASLGIIVGNSFSGDAEARGRFENFELLTEAEIAQLASSGFEILSHSLTHRYASGMTREEVRRELEDSKRLLETAGMTPLGFAVPYGNLTPALQELAPQYYSYLRSSEWGHNSVQNLDAYNLKTKYLQNTTSTEQVLGWIDTAFDDDAWLILLFHRVDDDCSQDEYCMRTTDFERIVDYAVEHCDVRTTGSVISGGGGRG